MCTTRRRANAHTGRAPSLPVDRHLIGPPIQTRKPRPTCPPKKKKRRPAEARGAALDGDTRLSRNGALRNGLLSRHADTQRSPEQPCPPASAEPEEAEAPDDNAPDGARRHEDDRVRSPSAPVSKADLGGDDPAAAQVAEPDEEMPQATE